MPYLEAVLSMPRSLPLYWYTRISSDLNSIRRTSTITKMLSKSRWTYFMPEIRSKFKKTQLPLNSPNWFYCLLLQLHVRFTSRNTCSLHLSLLSIQWMSNMTGDIAPPRSWLTNLNFSLCAVPAFLSHHLLSLCALHEVFTTCQWKLMENSA